MGQVIQCLLSSNPSTQKIQQSVACFQRRIGAVLTLPGFKGKIDTVCHFGIRPSRNQFLQEVRLPGVLVHTCNPIYLGGRGGMIKAITGKCLRSYLKSKLK
jgi:hypothetical protein